MNISTFLEAASTSRRQLVTRAKAAAVLALVVAFGGACGGAAGRYVRVEDLPRTLQPSSEYRIASGDVLAVRVWNDASLSLDRAVVREDGKITMPFLQDVEVVGKTPAELAERLKVQLKTYVVTPLIVVSVVEQHPLRVSITGEVTRPGVYDLGHGAGVLSALAVCGGLTEFAHRDRIFVLRKSTATADPAPTRIRFRYEALTRGEKAAAGFQLQAGDVLVVE